MKAMKIDYEIGDMVVAMYALSADMNFITLDKPYKVTKLYPHGVDVDLTDLTPRTNGYFLSFDQIEPVARKETPIDLDAITGSGIAMASVAPKPETPKLKHAHKLEIQGYHLTLTHKELKELGTLISGLVS